MTTTAETTAWSPPELPRPAPVREWLIEKMFRFGVRTMPITAALPGGERFGGGGSTAPVMRIERPGAFFRRLAVCGPIGFSESYVAGEWTSSDPAAVLVPFAERLTKPVNRPMAVFRRWADQHVPASERNTVEGAKENVRRHYDLPSDFFALFLDESMTYSAALFEPGADLHSAQLRKIDAVLDQAHVGEGSRVLEIGSGWGALALRAAERGAEVTTATISAEQRRFVAQLVDAAGLAGRVRVLAHDYRELEGRYDAVVSVEMIEAVGMEYWPTYFSALERLLAPGGHVVLQTITMSHDRMLATKDVHTWIQKYVFPGGQVLSVRAVEEQAHQAGLTITARSSLGDSYARTLRCWRDRLHANRDEAMALGFGGTFLRTWEYYLAYAEAGFRAAHLDAWQFRLGRGCPTDGPTRPTE